MVNIYCCDNNSKFYRVTGVEVVHRVEELVSLGVQGAQRVYMTQWRGRLILAVIETSGVSLYAVEPQTHRVGHTGYIPEFYHLLS